MTIRELAEADVLDLLASRPQHAVRRFVGWFESRRARARCLTGKQRSKYQRAFHKALSAVLKAEKKP